MNMYFSQSGDREAQTLIFIHGGGMDGSIWRESVNFFHNYHCIVIDLPEHGRSVDLKPFSIIKSVELIAELIRNNSNGKKVSVIGHSLGGVILINLLSMHPELVDHAVVASGNIRPTAIYKVFTNTIVCKFVSILNQKVNKKEYITSEMLKRIYNEMIENSRIPSKLYGTKTPILFIEGEKEQKFLKDSNKDLINICKNAKGITILKANHNYPWEEHCLFNEIVNAWLDDRLIEDKHISIISQN